MTAVYQHLGLTPKGVDMWCGNNQTLHLIQWLEDIGFNKFLHLVPSNTVSHVVTWHQTLHGYFTMQTTGRKLKVNQRWTNA